MNFLAQMALAGAVAAVGMWVDTIHVVIGAMILAPAFEPLVRVPFGLLTGSTRLAKRGLGASAAGYAALAGAGFVFAQVMVLVEPGRIDGFASQKWVQFFSTVGATDVITSILAGLAGAFIIAGQRAVLTTGVMIALALIPSASLVGVGLDIGELGVAGGAFVRWLVDVVIVVLASALVFWLKDRLLHRPQGEQPVGRRVTGRRPAHRPST